MGVLYNMTIEHNKSNCADSRATEIKIMMRDIKRGIKVLTDDYNAVIEVGEDIDDKLFKRVRAVYWALQ